LAGLSVTYGNVGEVIQQGDPVGLLSGQEAKTGDFLINHAQVSGSSSQETLYIEIRKQGTPANPLDWFDLAQN